MTRYGACRSIGVGSAVFSLGFTLLMALLSGCAVSGVSSATSSSTPSSTSAATDRSTATITAKPPAHCGDTFDYSSVPATPTALPGPMAAHISATITANGPTGASTTHITAGSSAYVIITIHDVPAGESHVVSVAWSWNGQGVGIRPQQSQQTVTGPGLIYYSLSFPKNPAVGGVAVYFDLPQSDATLAQTFTFGLYC